MATTLTLTILCLFGALHGYLIRETRQAHTKLRREVQDLESQIHDFRHTEAMVASNAYKLEINPLRPNN